MEPVAGERPPGASPPGTKSALAFYGVLLVLFLPALLAQWASPVAGLAGTQLFAFLLPAIVATAGSSLRVAPYLRLGRARPPLVVLGALCGGAAYLVAGAVMAFTQHVLPRAWVQTYDLARLFEGPPGERLALAAIAVILAPACEEVTFRGYLQTTLSLRRCPEAAIGTGALMFAALHLDPVRFPALVVLGTLFGWLTWRAGSVWPAVAAHAANNGIAASLLVAGEPPDVPAGMPLRALATTLAVGTAALALLVAFFRAAAPSPPAVAEALVPADAAATSIAWRPERVPRRLAALALAGVAALLALGLAGLVRGVSRGS